MHAFPRKMNAFPLMRVGLGLITLAVIAKFRGMSMQDVFSLASTIDRV